MAGELKPFEDNLYCPIDSESLDVMAGKDWLLSVFDPTGEKLLAIAGQQSFKLNREADTISVNTKTNGGWGQNVVGIKNWSIDSGGIAVANDESHKILSKAFNDGEPLCLKAFDVKRKKPLFGGWAHLTSYPFDAPYDDSVSYETSFKGNGPLYDLSEMTNVDKMPEGIE